MIQYKTLNYLDSNEDAFSMLQKKLDSRMDRIKELENQLDKTTEALNRIEKSFIRSMYDVSMYLGFNEDMESICDACEKALCMNTTVTRHGLSLSYEGKLFWALLVDIFGDYGTSPSSGWIEDVKTVYMGLKPIIELYKDNEDNEY